MNISAKPPQESVPADRKPRADGRRNRELLIAAARGVFEEIGASVSLEEIARRAGVGIGTLYRHFSNREAIVEAVYRLEIEKLVGAVPQLLQGAKGAEGLHRWLYLFVDYLGAKRFIAPLLSAAPGGTTALYASSAELLKGAIATLVGRSIEDGSIRADTDPADLMRAMVGVSYGNVDAGWEKSARRLVDIVMDGLRRG